MDYKSVFRSRLVSALAAVGLSLVTGCATSTAVHAPRNYIPVDEDAPRSELREISTKTDEPLDFARMLNRVLCADPLLAKATEAFRPRQNVEQLSVGDILNISVSDGEEFSGNVEIGPNGDLDIPYLAPIAADGLSLRELEDKLAHRLVRDGFYKRGFAVVTIERMSTGPRRVAVGGAVFVPGVFVLNDRAPTSIRDLEDNAYGDKLTEPTVANAILRAAGIRPDADIANVVLVRNGERSVLDLSGAFDGKPIENPVVMSGDEIIVPSRGCFQEKLARVSAVTTPGVRLYMSNLTQPASSNAQSAIGRDSINFPYGTRLLQAVVSANCVGGAHVTNANRYVVFMTRDWESGRTVVVERPIEALVRRADRDHFNPYLQEGDALACYDSAVTNARDVLDMLSDAFAPAIFARGIIGD